MELITKETQYLQYVTAALIWVQPSTASRRFAVRRMKIYVVWTDGRVSHIVRGRVAALKISPAKRPFKTQLEAEEFAAWWNHDNHKPWWPDAPARLLDG